MVLSAIFRRFKADSPVLGNDLNKKILEAFNSIIDKGTKSSAIRKEPTTEPINRYNVDSRNSVVKVQDYKSKISSISNNEPILIRNSPDIFKRNKISPQFLHKVNIADHFLLLCTHLGCLFDEQNAHSIRNHFTEIFNQ